MALRAGRLSTVLARRDAQVHRTLGGSVELPDLVRVARVNAMVAVDTGALTGRALERGAVDAPAAGRLMSATGTVEAVWTQVAELAGDFVALDARTDPLLVRAAAETRAAVRDVACAPMGVQRRDDLLTSSSCVGPCRRCSSLWAARSTLPISSATGRPSRAGDSGTSAGNGRRRGDASRRTTSRRYGRGAGGTGGEQPPHLGESVASGRRPLPAAARDQFNSLLPAVVTASGRAAAVHLKPDQTQPDAPLPQRRRSRQRDLQAPNRRAQAPSAPTH